MPDYSASISGLFLWPIEPGLPIFGRVILSPAIVLISQTNIISISKGMTQDVISRIETASIKLFNIFFTLSIAAETVSVTFVQMFLQMVLPCLSLLSARIVAFSADSNAASIDVL